jgi:hypothetical protein
VSPGGVSIFPYCGFTGAPPKNVWITTSGSYSTMALDCAMQAMGTGRIMFSVDYLGKLVRPPVR